jgi:hypothetical protein
MSGPSKGDPEGHRLAGLRKSERLLSEAGRVAYALEALIRRAGYDTEVCGQLIRI